MIEQKKLGKGTLQVVNIHKCELPRTSDALNAGAAEGSVWTCAECHKRWALHRESDQREGTWWEWRSR